MPFVTRDQSGRISGVSDHAEVGVSEEIRADDPELSQFLVDQGLSTPEVIRQRLAESDLQMVRLVDDLIDLLMDKGVIKFTDLPQAAGEKYLHRQVARRRLQSNLIVDENDIL
ncbi:MAG: hypothetical protein A3F77_01835 [Betaproteobacteria bacterium RIFCSPLOWO2_12_FULL_67_28]|nr:MAG: hypothetical protein A3F77_01835 [Betaproteobacteria bacterium RIFCSPLOWO2_12_FULL_67_28]